NVVTGGDLPQLAGDGLFLRHDERYRMTEEFLHIWRGVSAGKTVDYEGDHLHVAGARLHLLPVQQPYPSLYFGGSSEIAREVAARHADVYLTWGEPPADVAEQIAAVRQ